MSATKCFFDTLESRTFLSAAPAAVADAPPASAAIEVSASPRIDLRSAVDALGDLRQQLVDARQAVRDALDGLQDELAPLREQLKTDLALVKDDLRQMRDVRRAHRETILSDLQSIHDAKETGDDQALADARASLQEHREARQQELAPLREQLREHLELVKADRDAVKDLVDNDPKIQAAREKVADLRAAIKNWFEEHFG